MKLDELNLNKSFTIDSIELDYESGSYHDGEASPSSIVNMIQRRRGNVSQNRLIEESKNF